MVDAEGQLIQAIEQPGSTLPILAIDCVDGIGRLAVANGQAVVIYSLEKGDAAASSPPPLRWRETETLALGKGPRQHEAARSVSWSHDGQRLLVGGTSLTLWADKSLLDDLPDILEEHFDTNQCAASGSIAVAWTATPATPVDLAVFSPDDRLFVSLSAHDCRPKVWFERETEVASLHPGYLQYEFAYLPHPCPVVTCSWRPSRGAEGNSGDDQAAAFRANVLLTSAADGVCRLWAESAPTEAATLRICGAISPPEPGIASSSPSMLGDEVLLHHWLLDPPPDASAAGDAERRPRRSAPGSPSAVSRTSASDMPFGSPMRTAKELAALRALRIPSGHSVRRTADAEGHKLQPSIRSVGDCVLLVCCAG